MGHEGWQSEFERAFTLLTKDFWRMKERRQRKRRGAHPDGWWMKSSGGGREDEKIEPQAQGDHLSEGYHHHPTVHFFTRVKEIKMIRDGERCFVALEENVQKTTKIDWNRNWWKTTGVRAFMCQREKRDRGKGEKHTENRRMCSSNSHHHPSFLSCHSHLGWHYKFFILSLKFYFPWKVLKQASLCCTHSAPYRSLFSAIKSPAPQRHWEGPLPPLQQPSHTLMGFLFLCGLRCRL